MSHGRKQIRDAIVTALTGLATTGANVWANRVYPLDDAALPGLIIRTGPENVTPGGTLGKKIRRVVTFEVEGRVKAEEGDDPLDDQLDQICAEVEAALADDVTLGGLVQSCALSATRPSYSGAMERPVGIVVMSWVVAYQTLADAPETLLYAP